jgi:hemerythrin superfamily protein
VKRNHDRAANIAQQSFRQLTIEIGDQVMARSTQSRSSDAPRDAVALLKRDHRMVESLFKQFSDAEEEEQSSLAERVCQMLTVHAQIEEEILYPAAKQALEEDEEEAELVSEALVEHGSAKELIAKIEGMSVDDEAFKATVKVLCEYINHHVKEEENELFPALKKTELDLKELGARLSERKHALMEQMGIAIEEEETTSARRRTARPRTAQARSRASGNRRSRASSSRH